MEANWLLALATGQRLGSKWWCQGHPWLQQSDKQYHLVNADVLNEVKGRDPTTKYVPVNMKPSAKPTCSCYTESTQGQTKTEPSDAS
ncbi:unnamed protein product [Ilex paraguariensis]|uniref:Uncharacterized protein n=1 Tax=Ilex paraguariensis TaxID=185542 RepID=A0ABC8RDP7_9AQUA